MSDVLTAIKKRSSIRSYKNEKLSEEQIHTLLEAGLQAPTARNEQEIHFSVLSGDSPLLQEIEDEKRRLIRNELDERLKANVFQSSHNFYFESPTVILLSADRKLKWSQVDAGIAVENISLAATSLGLGSLIIGSIKDALTGEKASYFADKAQFPQDYEFVIAIAVGYISENKVPHEFDLDRSVSFIK